jgi:hypothetical protein
VHAVCFSYSCSQQEPATDPTEAPSPTIALSQKVLNFRKLFSLPDTEELLLEISAALESNMVLLLAARILCLPV